MPKITLPDGSVKDFPCSITINELARSIGSGLAQAAIAGKVDGHLHDLVDFIEADSSVSIITKAAPEAIDIVRHSCAHLFGQALKQLYPEAQMAIGPVIDDGFYYDFHLEHKISSDDLAAIEERMRKLAATSYPVLKRVLERDQAIQIFRERGEHYKLKLIEDLPDESSFALYFHEDYVDMCKGPHLPSMAHMGAFKLTKLAGAYWRGDSNNEMLQRVYGTCWHSQAELDEHLEKLAEAERRDHRKLAKKLDLFHTQEEAPGLIFWHPKGMVIYRLIEAYIARLMQRHGYQEIRTPQLLDRSLWEKSGHWDKYKSDMFTTSSENRDYAIKPMSCPGHVQVFNQGLKSYRDLPIRFSEFGAVHRNEASGTLHGLMRVRGFVQDDAHIFLTEDQIQSEVGRSIDLIRNMYSGFGFDDVLLKLSTRPEQRVGSDAIWDKAEQALAQALSTKGLEFEYAPGDGAFYGPKIDFSLRDSIGRVWQCGTLQIDFSMPERLDATYVDEQGQKQRPVMIHQAVLGSIERFIGVLIEHNSGNLPLALAPLQAVVMSVTDHQLPYAKRVCQQLQSLGMRVELDSRQEKISYKIREHSLARVPYQIIVGKREVENDTVSVRNLAGEDLGAQSITAFHASISDQLNL